MAWPRLRHPRHFGPWAGTSRLLNVSTILQKQGSFLSSRTELDTIGVPMGSAFVSRVVRNTATTRKSQSGKAEFSTRVNYGAAVRRPSFNPRKHTESTAHLTQNPSARQGDAHPQQQRVIWVIICQKQGLLARTSTLASLDLDLDLGSDVCLAC